MALFNRKSNLLYIVILILLATGIAAYFLFRSSARQEIYTEPGTEQVDPLKASYDISALDNSAKNRKIKYGYELFVHTPQYIGPENGNPKMAYAGNNLACNNCHLKAGTKPYSGLLIGVTNRFPQFRGRENKMGTIEDRINGCMERSMNGRKLPVRGKEMKAFVSYLTWLSRYAPKDGKLEGIGSVKLELPDRAVDLQKGKALFTEKCGVCHGNNGLGLARDDNPGYVYPPLWGDDSFNNGAGMARVITAAEFIKTNMPFGVAYEDPVLSDEECYDLAGYINQQSRPIKPDLKKDFPDLKLKPVSTPYPPYADPFSVQQHQMGPFQPIIEFYQQKYDIKKSK